MHCKRDIDFVYLWVDGNDPKQKESLARELVAAGKTLPPHSECRFADSQELRFSLRSLEQNAPWIHNIFIVTNGQIPKWLDTSHHKIKTVFHSEFMPADTLPTFNSNAIASCLCDIPRLSEYFLYGNDDCFIGSPVEPSFFFTDDSKPVVYGYKEEWNTKNAPAFNEDNYSDMYRYQTFYNIKLIQKFFNNDICISSSHNIQSHTKSIFKKCRNAFSSEFKTTCNSKFRKAETVLCLIHSLWAILSEKSPFIDLSERELCFPLLSGLELKKILSPKPVLFCINDNEDTLDDDRAALTLFLQELFPHKAAWEKEDVPPVALRKPSLSTLVGHWVSYTVLRLVYHCMPGKIREQWKHKSDLTRRKFKSAYSLLRLYPNTVLEKK